MYTPTREQMSRMNELLKEGWKMNVNLSLSYCAVALDHPKLKGIYVIGFDESISHIVGAKQTVIIPPKK